jgi:hypothetical protein
MDHEIELVGQGCVKIMAYTLGLGAINDANSPLKPFCSQQVGNRVRSAQIKIEAFLFEPGKNLFVTAW